VGVASVNEATGGLTFIETAAVGDQPSSVAIVSWLQEVN
jgi:hypothetical protein